MTKNLCHNDRENLVKIEYSRITLEEYYILKIYIFLALFLHI